MCLNTIDCSKTNPQKSIILYCMVLYKMHKASLKDVQINFKNLILDFKFHIRIVNARQRLIWWKNFLFKDQNKNYKRCEKFWSSKNDELIKLGRTKKNGMKFKNYWEI